MLFNLYIDDIISEIKDLNCGMHTEDEIISILLYADDIGLIASERAPVFQGQILSLNVLIWI